MNTNYYFDSIKLVKRLKEQYNFANRSERVLRLKWTCSTSSRARVEKISATCGTKWKGFKVIKPSSSESGNRFDASKHGRE